MSGSGGNSMILYLNRSYEGGINTRARWKPNGWEPTVTHISWKGWGSGYVFVICTVIFLMLKQNYKVTLIIVVPLTVTEDFMWCWCFVRLDIQSWTPWPNCEHSLHLPSNSRASLKWQTCPCTSGEASLFLGLYGLKAIGY